jgi:hypothetical protein
METVWMDIEFRFASGDSLCVSVQEGRDLVAADAERIRVVIRDGDGVDETIISRPLLNYFRTTKRVVKPEATIEEAGSVKLVGISPE